MKKNRLISLSKLTLGVAALMAAPAYAGGFVNNASGWLALPPDAKAAYVQALSDSANLIFVDDELATAIVKLARTRCLVEQKTTAAILADRVTMAYTKDAKLANFPPSVIYIMRMADVCRTTINEERARFSLPPV
ncbi:MAG: hypothetical protein IPN84_07550 [Sphingomonadales bacterium]|jgi:hypothetical protein|nr:hypothetical protein [Sphingomonadales bacterium]